MGGYKVLVITSAVEIVHICLTCPQSSPLFSSSHPTPCVLIVCVSNKRRLRRSQYPCRLICFAVSNKDEIVQNAVERLLL